tara:strand:- start:271 stop:474 length:204 start_codon:yes stop_codon:yes gene_type:complete
MKHKLEFTTEEIFELIQSLKSAVENKNADSDLLSAFKKINGVKMPEFKNLNYGYEIPHYKPRKEEKE